MEAPVTSQDSAALVRLRARVAGQQAVRVRVGREWWEFTRPEITDSTIAYHDAWPDRLERQDSTLPNPLPLTQVSALQVQGKAVLPAALFGGLSLGVSALASTLLTKVISPQTAPDGGTIVQVTLLGIGVGAAVGAAEGALRSRWVTVYPP